MSELLWLQLGIVALLISLFASVGRALTQNRWLREAAWWSLLLSFASLVGSLVERSLHAQYFALSNMYESLLVLSLSIQAAFLIMDRWFRLPAFGWPVCLLLLACIGFDTTLSREIAPLQPALQSYWRSIHVPVIISAYGLFSLAAVASVIHLVQSRGVSSATTGTTPGSPASTVTTLTADATGIYDEITYRCVAFGFPLLAIGIILGGLWANEAWGNYWSWDPKESMSLVTLLGYGVYLHLRVNGEHSGRTLAWVSLISFGLMLVTYFGVNLMGVGLHSYGKIG